MDGRVARLSERDQTVNLVEAIDLAKDFVQNCRDGDRHEMTREDVNRLYDLAQQVHRLAFALGVADALPRAAELQPQLESGALPPVQFESKLNLPGDWDYLAGPVRDISELRHHNGDLVLPHNCYGDDVAEWEPQERVYLVCATPRWWQDIEALRNVAIDAEVRQKQSLALKPDHTNPTTGEMPWEANGWDRPTPQVARILCYMWDRKSAKRDDLVQSIWGSIEQNDGTVTTAVCRTNEYLRINKHTRVLEKTPFEDTFAWV